MKTIGLTGDAGSGKSTVARILNTLGAEVIDADHISRDVAASASPVLASLTAHFGPAILTPTGELDRNRLATLIFNDPSAYRTLDAIILPPILRTILERKHSLEHEGAEVVVLDIPRLFEVGFEREVDEVWVVTADHPLKTARLTARGIPAARAQKILQNQMPEEEKVRRAHRVIDNNGSLTDLKTRVIKAWTSFHPE